MLSLLHKLSIGSSPKARQIVRASGRLALAPHGRHLSQSGHVLKIKFKLDLTSWPSTTAVSADFSHHDQWLLLQRWNCTQTRHMYAPHCWRHSWSCCCHHATSLGLRLWCHVPENQKCWVQTWSKNVAQHNWTKLWLKKGNACLLVFFFLFSKTKQNKEKHLDQALTQEKASFGPRFDSTACIYIYIDRERDIAETHTHIYIYIYITHM